MRDLKYRKTAKKRNTTRHGINAERVRMHVSKGDTVRVMRGDDKGKEGKVLRIYLKTGRVLVEGINIVKKHRKARTAEEQSGIIESPAPVHSSNVMLLDSKTGEPTRTRVKLDTDKNQSASERRRSKERVGARSGEAIPRIR
jgi:large subunit ribosomal protein L24